METFWVIGKGVIAHKTLIRDSMLLNETPDSSGLQRQTSQHSSLAAVVYGLMQANRRSTRVGSTASTTTSKFMFNIELSLRNISCFRETFCTRYAQHLLTICYMFAFRVVDDDVDGCLSF